MSNTPATEAKRTTRGMRMLRYLNGMLVLTIGASLFVFTGYTERFFAWTVQSQLTAATLGALYLAAAIREFIDARQAMWANSRAAVPGVIVFSVLMLIATALHIDRFHFGSPIATAALTAWLWTLVYAIVPIALFAAWIVQARAPGGDPPPSEPPARLALAALASVAVALVALGAALFLAPQALISVWPWPLTPLTGRAMAAWLVGIGLVLGRAGLENDLRRAWSNFAFLLALGALQSLALARFPNEFAWGSLTGWIYLAWLAAEVILGIYGLAAGIPSARRARQTAEM